jgi:hypothetical protein
MKINVKEFGIDLDTVAAIGGLLVAAGIGLIMARSVFDEDGVLELDVGEEDENGEQAAGK